MVPEAKDRKLTSLRRGSLMVSATECLNFSSSCRISDTSHAGKCKETSRFNRFLWFGGLARHLRSCCVIGDCESDLVKTRTTGVIK